MTAERIPPHNDEAEQSVLGACMLSQDALYDVIEKGVKPEDFYGKHHQEIFEAILTLAKKDAAVDMLTVCDELKRRNALEVVGGRSYIATLTSLVPSTANAAQYAVIVEEKAEMRRLIEAAGGIVEQGYSAEMEAKEILDHAEQAIFEIAEHHQKEDTSALKDILEENIRQISQRAEHPGELTGVPTGLVDLDRKTNGLQPSDLIILAARPSMGKTAFALTMARNAAEQGKKVLIFSLEMAKYQLSQRLIAMESSVDAQKLRSGDLDAEDWRKISAVVDRMSAMDIEINDTASMTPLEIKNKCRRKKAEKGLDLIIVDYLQIMDVGSLAENRALQLATATRGLKQMARELECPVVLLSQLNRNVEGRTGNRPMLSDLKESGAIEQDADVVLFLHRDDYQNPESERPGECEVIIAKQRNGPTDSVYVRWLEKYTRFVNKSYQ